MRPCWACPVDLAANQAEGGLPNGSLLSSGPHSLLRQTSAAQVVLIPAHLPPLPPQHPHLITAKASCSLWLQFSPTSYPALPEAPLSTQFSFSAHTAIRIIWNTSESTTGPSSTVWGGAQHRPFKKLSRPAGGARDVCRCSQGQEVQLAGRHSHTSRQHCGPPSLSHTLVTASGTATQPVS